jgi:hypothetical protein
VIGSFASARQKFRRAVEHLNALDDEVRRFVYQEIERLEAERDPEIDEWIQPTWFAMGDSAAKTDSPFKNTPKARKELPARFGVILGDYLSNLRSALDHAANAAAGANAGDYTKFPICAKTKTFKDGADKDLAGVPDPCRAAIERMQPYHGHSRGKRLALLAKLCNIDKHKVLHASTFLTYPGVWTFGPPYEGATAGFSDYGALGEKAEVRITFDGPDGEPKVEGGQPYQISFADRPGSQALITRLDMTILRDEVRRIIAEIQEVAVAGHQAPPG